MVQGGSPPPPPAGMKIKATPCPPPPSIVKQCHHRRGGGGGRQGAETALVSTGTTGQLSHSHMGKKHFSVAAWDKLHQ